MPQARAAKPARRKPSELRALQPNLIVTIDERHRRLANDEIGHILQKASIESRITGPPGQGLVGVYVADDPRACIARLRSLLSSDPFAFQHTHRWLPIEAWARAEEAEIARFADHAMAEIAPDESWRIRAERHSSKLEPMMLVTALAKGIDNRRVDLENPDKTILMEIVGQRAGLAVVEKDQTLSVEAEMKGFVEFEEVR